MKIFRGKRGFTLIELLVVIAIIAILAAILFPVYARLREKARQTQCVSNVKQTVMAFKTYLDDYDSKYPFVGNCTPASGAFTAWPAGTRPVGWTWPIVMDPYVKSPGILGCPSAGVSGAPDDGATPVSKPFSYFFNGRLSGNSEGAVAYPANCILMGDWKPYAWNLTGAAGSANGISIVTWTQGVPAAADYNPNGGCLERHNPGAIYGFCDGHAKNLRPSNIRPFPPVATAPTDADKMAYPTFWP